MKHLRLFLIALFLTASLRLVPLPVSDTVRHALLAMLIVFSGIDGNYRINVGFAKRIAPFLVCLFVPTVFDMLFGLFGYYSLVIWAQLMAALFVANAVFATKPDDLRKLILWCAGILIVQFIYLKMYPGSFAARGRDIGISDSFVTYGATLQRIYFAYFQSNAAAYSIFFMLLSWFVINQRTFIPRLQFAAVTTLLIVFAIMTGSRGVILLIAGFLPAWYLSFRSTAAMTFLSLTAVLGMAILPITEAIVGLVSLRQSSNDARLEAIWNYVDILRENPFYGLGVDAIRHRTDVLGLKPSHFFIAEVLGTYGVLFGSFMVLFLIYSLIIRPSKAAYRVAGFFAFAVGFFNNALLTTWAFFPLIVPLMMTTWSTTATTGYRPGTGSEHDTDTEHALASTHPSGGDASAQPAPSLQP